jgi:probable O-glycosylation ligase (exosortase A-associated)
MRDIALFIIVGGLLPYILMRPQVGIYAWSWLSYMNPHRLTWGFAYNFPFAQSVALATLLSILFWKQPKRIPMTGITILWVMFIVWMLLTTIFSMYPESAWVQYEKVIKIQLVTFLTMMIIRTHKEVNILVWVIALSIGFYAIKGGLFTIKTLGGARVWGPPRSFIEDNNALAVASLMILPLFYYLSQQVKRKIVRYMLLGAMLLMTVSIIGSQSRGALLAVTATGFFLWLKTPRKLLSGALIVILSLGIISFMPQSWHDRMDLIENYEQDSSAMGRIAAWKMSLNVANDRPFGGGLFLWKPATYMIYGASSDDWQRNTAAHSIYFSILAEHGWIGLLLFVSIFVATWRTASRLIKRVRGSPELKWVSDLMRMLQVSMIAYAVGGAFLQLAYFDLPWHLVSIVVVTRFIVDKNLSIEGVKTKQNELTANQG